MSETLTSAIEPGFFSNVTEASSMALAPTTVNMVGIIGTGSETKAVSENVTRGVTGASDELSNPVSSVSLTSTDSVYQFPLSSYGLSAKGSTSHGPTGIWYVGAKVISVVVGGVTASHTFSGSEGITGIVADINADVNVTGYFKAVATSDYKVQLYSTDGQSLVIGSGDANVLLGFTSGQIASGIYWNPSITDESLAPQLDTIYKVSYITPKIDSDYAPTYYASSIASRQIANDYGGLSLDNTVVMGANAASAAGASVLVVRQIPSGTTGSVRRADISESLVDLENTNVNIVVPMVPVTDDLATIPLYLNHVSKMSSKLERKERIVILGADERSAMLDVYGATGSWEQIANYFDVSASSGLKPKRVLVMAPGQAVFTTADGVSLTADGTYIAAALAGRMVSSEFDSATPMTRKTLPTIESLVSIELDRASKNILTSWGLTVVEMKNGLATVRRASTMDVTNIAAQEPSIVRSFDQVVVELREALEQRFVGVKIVPLVNRDIEAHTETLLSKYVANQIIGGFRGVRAVQNALEPRQFDISFEGIPVFPLLWGMVDLSIVLS